MQRQKWHLHQNNSGYIGLDAAIKMSIVSIQTTTITKKQRRKKVFIVAIIQFAAISIRNAITAYILQRFYIPLL